MGSTGAGVLKAVNYEPETRKPAWIERPSIIILGSVVVCLILFLALLGFGALIVLLRGKILAW